MPMMGPIPKPDLDFAMPVLPFDRAAASVADEAPDTVVVATAVREPDLKMKVPAVPPTVAKERNSPDCSDDVDAEVIVGGAVAPGDDTPEAAANVAKAVPEETVKVWVGGRGPCWRSSMRGTSRASSLGLLGRAAVPTG
jgi:hypothetical protein